MVTSCNPQTSYSMYGVIMNNFLGPVGCRGRKKIQYTDSGGLMVDTVIPITGEVYLEPRHPQSLGNGTVGFSLVVAKVGVTEVLLESKGWRIFRGQIVPPSRQDRKGTWVKTMVPSQALLEQLAIVVEGWRKRFPTVEFPATQGFEAASK